MIVAYRMLPFRAFLTREDGEDLAEYALLLAFILISSIAMFLVSGANLVGFFSMTNRVGMAVDTAIGK